jgi:flagellar hook-associated protein 3 FlgL
MRPTELSNLNRQQRILSDVSERLLRVQNELASNKRIQVASDDPAGAAQALTYRKDIAYEAQMRRNMDGATAYMNVSESALGSATDTLQRVRELVVQAANDTTSASDRQAISAEIEQLTQHLAQVANTQFAGVYVFSGNKTGTAAYQVTGNPPTAITYQGDTGARVRRIGDSQTMTVNVPGSTVFGQLFDDLITLRDNLNSGASAATIQTSLQSIDWASDRITQARADLGARVNRVDATKQQSEDIDLHLQSLRSEVEDVDVTDAIIRLNREQVAQQAALGAIGRTSNMTLLNFLR